MPALITGPPRSRKTYTAINKWINYPENQDNNFSGNPAVIVSRTKENAVQTYQTVKEHIEGVDDVNIVLYFGIGEVCPSVDQQEKLQKQRIQHHKNCKGNKNPVKVDQEVMQEVLEDKDFNSKSWHDFYKRGECPWAVQNAFLSRTDLSSERVLILTTYASLSVINEQHPEIFNSSCVMLDEARHYINHVPVKQIPIGEGLKYSSIFEDYRAEVERISLDKYFEDETAKNRVKESINSYLDYLDTVLSHTIKARELERKSEEYDQKTAELVEERFKSGARLEDHLPPEDWRADFETYRWLKKEMEAGESSKFPGERIHDAYCKPEIDVLKKWIEKIDKSLKSNEAIEEDGLKLYRFLSNAREVIENGKEVKFDLVDTETQERSLMMYITSRSKISRDGSADISLESRPLLSQIHEKASSLVLIDSTFFPEKFWNFFFGEKTELNQVRLQANYEFAIVVEDVKYSISQSYRNQSDKNRLIKKVKGVQRRLREEDKESAIFGRNKDEKNMLANSGIQNVFYSRGTEVEGTEVDGDYTINCGIPLQNIHSENYRKYDLARSLWLDDNEETPEKIVSEYRDVKAYQELLQQSFRTVKQEGASGTLWLNTSFNVLQNMESYWPWLSDFRQVRMSKSKNKELPEKIEEAVHGLLYGMALEQSRRRRKIKEGVIDYVSENSQPNKETVCEEVRKDLEVRKNTVHEVIDELIESNDLKVEKAEPSGRGKPPSVLEIL